MQEALYSPSRKATFPALKPNEVMVAAVAHIMQRHPNANEDLVRTMLYSKHPEAARYLAKTESFEQESRIVRVAIQVHQQQAMKRKPRSETKLSSRHQVWIG